jgi:type IV pilus assembly protein PilC
MTMFEYKALDKTGKEIRGSGEAESEESIVDRLRGMGYFPTDITEVRQSLGQRDLNELPVLKQLFGRVKQKHITVFTRQLATLIEAGLPLLRGLRIIEGQSESVQLRTVLADVSEEIEAGATLSEGLAKYPRVFSKLFINMVRAGEIGGVLEAVLARLAVFMEKAQAMKAKIRSAMMYPVVVSILAGIIVSLILIFIVPRFEDIYADIGADLPLMTQMLVTASEVIMHKWYFVLAFIAFIVISYRMIKKTERGRFVIDTVKLKFPLLGTLFNKTAIANFSRTLSTLLNSGVPILQALDIVRDSAGNEVISRAMVEVHDSIREGESIHEPLSRYPVFPDLVVHMIAVGEETGAVDKMLTKVAEAYELEVDTAVDGLTSLIEPLLIVMLGIVIGFIVIALYMPMIQIVPNVP